MRTAWFRYLRVALAVPAFALSGCSGGSSAAADAMPHAPTPSDAPIRSSVARLAAAWNAGSGTLWAAEYWPDGELINILGVLYVGAPAVGRVTTAILSGPFAGSHFASIVRNVRFLGSDAALVETDVDVSEFRALPPGAVSTAPGLLSTRFTHVYVRRGGTWRILMSQNTSVLPKPAVAGAGA